MSQKNKDPLIFVKHVKESINNLDLFLKEVTKEDFFGDIEKQSAVVRQLEIIGEAVKNLPHNFRKKYPSIPWIDIAGTRDKIIHHYFGIKLNLIWDIIKEDIPKLKKDIQEILEKEEAITSVEGEK